MKRFLPIFLALILTADVLLSASPCYSKLDDEPALKTGVDALINSGDQFKNLKGLTKVKRRAVRQAMRAWAKKNGKSLSEAAKLYAKNWRKIGKALESGGDLLNDINKLQNYVNVGGKIIDGDVKGALKDGKDAALSDWFAAGGAWAGAKLGACIAGPEGAIVGGLGGAIGSSVFYNKRIKPCLDAGIDIAAHHTTKKLEAWNEAERKRVTPLEQEMRLRDEWESVKAQRHIAPGDEKQAFELWKLQKEGRLRDKEALSSLTSKYNQPEPPKPSPPDRQPRSPLESGENKRGNEPSRFGEDTDWWPTTGNKDNDFGEIASPPVAKPKQLIMKASSSVLSTVKPRKSATRYPSNKWTRKTVINFRVIAVYEDGTKKDVTYEAWYSTGTGNKFCLAGQSVAKYPYKKPVTITAKYRGAQASVVLTQRNDQYKALINAMREADRKTRDMRVNEKIELNKIK
jgi:hypothetical protein